MWTCCGESLLIITFIIKIRKRDILIWNRGRKMRSGKTLSRIGDVHKFTKPIFSNDVFVIKREKKITLFIIIWSSANLKSQVIYLFFHIDLPKEVTSFARLVIRRIFKTFSRSLIVGQRINCERPDVVRRNKRTLRGGAWTTPGGRCHGGDVSHSPVEQIIEKHVHQIELGRELLVEVAKHPLDPDSIVRVDVRPVDGCHGGRR